MFDKIAERAVDILSSGWLISIFTIWLVAHNHPVTLVLHTGAWLRDDYTNFISDVAIWIGLLILRAENKQNDRMEKKIEKVAKKS